MKDAVTSKIDNQNGHNEVYLLQRLDIQSEPMILVHNEENKVLYGYQYDIHNNKDRTK